MSCLNSYIKITGVIKFDPIDRTKKHRSQSSWKKVAIIEFNDDTDKYYSWFLKKRYSITLNPPLRGPHITFINDKWDYSEEEWLKFKKVFNGKEISLVLDTNVKSDGKHWWLNVDENFRFNLHSIREIMGLTPRPYYGLHMSIGFANEKNIEHSNYILDCIRKGFIKT